MEKLVEVMNNAYKMHEPEYLSKLNTIQELVEKINANVIMMQARRASIDTEKYLLRTCDDVNIQAKLNETIAKHKEGIKTLLIMYLRMLQELIAITIDEKEI